MTTSIEIEVKSALSALAERVTALEAELSQLKAERKDREMREGIRRSQEQFARGEGMPAREVFERLRKKHGIGQV